MARQLAPYHNLKGTARRSTRRSEAVREVQEGASVAEVARRHGVSRQTLYTWLERADGESGEVTLRPHGRPSLLGNDQRLKLENLLSKAPSSLGFSGRRWTLQTTRELIERELGVQYSSLSSVSMLLKSLGINLRAK